MDHGVPEMEWTSTLRATVFFSVEKMGKAEGVSDSKAEAGDDLRHQELWGGDGEEEAVRRGVLDEAGAENGEDVGRVME